MKVKQIAPRIWKVVLGSPQELTPERFAGEKMREELREKGFLSFPFAKPFEEEVRKSGFLATLPIQKGESIYGFGLQFESFRQNGKRKLLRTNADAPKDNGDSHAPVPFYVSTRGYGVLVDTCKNVEFDCGSAKTVQKAEKQLKRKEKIATRTEELYEEAQNSDQMRIYIQGVKGVILYIFVGETIKDVVADYNLFCGGGFLPPIWGLGNLYRCYGPANQQEIYRLMDEMEQDRMPLSMLGLEPGWHSHAYSCSYEWDPVRFPNPDELIGKAQKMGLELNLWEQAYVHPTARYYEELLPYTGDYEVWGGLVPDFTLEEGREIWGKRQGELMNQGIGAVKLDECDGSDYTGGWFFPDFAQFPGGLSGEEYKNFFGVLVQNTLLEEYKKRNRRTYSQVRASWSYGANLPFVLYSDLYGHEEFVRSVANMSFCGLLWSPEVRQCESGEELIRRMQSVVLSPLSIVNAWMIPHAPWNQFDIEKNKRGELLEDDSLKNRCRDLLTFRNALVPYLYSAYGRYYQEGIPPFRALVLDYPDDPQVLELDTEYMVGESLLAAPILEGQTGRDVYLPEGIWYDFWTGEKLEGKRHYSVSIPQIPLYVKENTLLPLADVQELSKDTVFPLYVRAYGENPEPARLIEDDRTTFDYESEGWEDVFLRVENGKIVLDECEGYTLEDVLWIK